MNPQEKYFALLHTSKKTSYSDDNTIIFSDLKDFVSPKNFLEFQEKLENQKSWLGYISYELDNEDIKINFPKNKFIEVDNCWFGNFKKIQKFKNYILPEASYKVPKLAFLKSNMTKQHYLEKVETIKNKIAAGEVYQANLTRKFYGEFEEKPDAFAIYCLLNKFSPAPYSAYIKIDDLHIISSSPELFLRVENNGKAITCPIKGSAGKGLGKQLGESKKDIAENLMITDLMRNDFSRACLAGSVKVDDLFEVNEFETISHMHSKISGDLGFDNNEVENRNKILKLIKDCSPAGSMTGAPKIAAMKLCAELEDWQRGIYSGAIGYLGFGDASGTVLPPSSVSFPRKRESNDDEFTIDSRFRGNDTVGVGAEDNLTNSILAEFSVVIRTIIIKGNKFEFQVGGGIVFDSVAEKEYNETLIKAAAICNVLGVEIDG
jgi:para-aminobenzoate synthetase component 1